MFKHLKQKLLGGLIFGLGATLVFGAFFLVQAVAPGEVTNPTFSPSDDDVAATISALYRIPDDAVAADCVDEADVGKMRIYKSESGNWCGNGNADTTWWWQVCTNSTPFGPVAWNDPEQGNPRGPILINCEPG